MRGLLVLLAALVVGAVDARAQPSSITLRADPVPIVEATINDRPVRLEVDTSLPDILVLNPDVAARLGVRSVPFTRVQAVLDDASIRGRLARPRVRFGDADARPLTGIFPAPASRRADGVIGPGVLPYDVITIELAQNPAAARDIVFTLENADIWLARLDVAPGIRANVDVSLAREPSFLNRPAVAVLEEARLLEPSGALEDREFFLGLTTQMQPVTVAPSVAAGAIAVGEALARTGAPILGASEPEAITVAADGRGTPRVTLGRAAIAGCSAIRVERAAKRMILTCP